MKKNFLILITVILTIFMVFSCKSDDDDNLSAQEKAEKYQDDLYNKVKNVIVGHWVAVQHWNTGEYNTRPVGWESISHISWGKEYTFNEDGTCVEKNHNLVYNGTYSITKNPDYIKYPSTSCELFLTIKTGKDVESRSAIWLDGEYLRLGSALMGIKPSTTSGGEAGIRYAKI